MKLAAFILAMSLLISFTLAADPPSPFYRNQFARTLGDTSLGGDVFRILCVLVTPKTTFASGLVSYPAPKGGEDSYARYLQMVQCHNNAKRHDRLDELCGTRPHEWQRAAQKSLRRCVHAPLTSKQRKVKGSFASRFNRTKCAPRYFGEIDGTNNRAVLICTCNQVQFGTKSPEVPPVVSVGGARFSALGVGTGTGNRKDLQVLQKCVESELPTGSGSCIAPGQNFNVLGRHILEACCKRARAQSKDRKFECKEIVPDDLTKINQAL